MTSEENFISLFGKYGHLVVDCYGADLVSCFNESGVPYSSLLFDKILSVYENTTVKSESTYSYVERLQCF